MDTCELSLSLSSKNPHLSFCDYTINISRIVYPTLLKASKNIFKKSNTVNVRSNKDDNKLPFS